jgi:hypothetical protein
MGSFSLLWLACVVMGLILVLRRRRISGKKLLLGALFLTGLTLLLFAEAFPRSHYTGWVLLLALMGVAIFWLRAESGGTQPATCPSVGLLKDFLAERLPPQEHCRLAAHLEDCPACQRWVEGLTAGQKSWVGVARKLSQHPPAGGPILQQVIDRLKGEPYQEATRDEPVFSADLPLGFLSPSEKPGQLGRLERYEVLKEVGRGGMGVVLKAFDPTLHRVVAIKVLAPQLATSGVARKRFLREVKAAAAVTHDHIVTIHAVDEANGLPYLVMQYVAGLSLQERIDKEGPLELVEILRIGMQTASGLAAAHGHGIVHRDIKPANILLEEGVPRVKITDFGLARAMDDANLTQSGFVAGSPLYMAPEQARGEALDHRADLFSLGSVLYTLCTGRPPFRAANTLAVLRRVCEDTPRPIRETNPEVPDWLAAVVEKLMAKDPAGRFQSAAEVVEVLGRHLAQLQNGAWVPPPVAVNDDADAGLPTSVTICPSCGASLHVPERMVGSTVHCGECGKPFRAEETSEEILVARPVPSPFGRRGRANRKVPAWTWVLVGGASLLFLLVLLSQRPQEGTTPLPPAPFWKRTLGWFPAKATLFGAVDLKAFGSLDLDEEWAQTVLRPALPVEVKKMLTPDTLGEIRLDSVSLAYYEDPNPEKSWGIVQLEGPALGGGQQIIDWIRQATSKKVRVEEDVRRGGPGKPLRVSGPELPFALGLFDDQRVFLARSMPKGSKESQHLKVLERLPCFGISNGPRPSRDILSGDTPPSLRVASREIPNDACGVFLGEIPVEWRQVLTEGLGLRTCPRTFGFSLKREGKGFALSLSLNLEKVGAELILVEDLEKWGRQGLDVLQAKFPSLRKEPEALALLAQTLKTLRWGANRGSGSVRTRVHISGPIVSAVGKLVERASGPHEEG